MSSTNANFNSHPNSQSKPQFAPGVDQTTLTSSLSPLLHPTGKWALTSASTGLQRTFKFKTFNKAWTFMDKVAAECKKHKHHPEWANTYNTVFVRWTTHVPKGLTEKDVNMAKVCDEVAKEVGEEVKEEKSEGVEGVLQEMKGLLEEAVKEAGDCCAPKKK
ncbi:hypothetical protein EG327_005507 [Venturia inaequalis]|uniref:4a-hydroxytetrahydrobiopterin dehydratase n=1 Tax=Venturia inaequalis TaxID=5025 RepID=A0A8H3VT49_VENIN|nr:hypothetical protein EG327_005507 [Venturia inaequalis]